MSIIRIEDLSNELFFEIFDYLDGCDIIKAFLNLNNRFRCLIQDLQFKIKLSFEDESIFNGIRKIVMIPDQEQIRSLYLWDNIIINRFFKLFPAHSSFHRLESLNLHFIRRDELDSILWDLTRFPRLFRLTIYLEHDSNDFSDIYFNIFQLPVLKYNKLSSLQKGIFCMTSNMTRRKVNTIEYLIIDHPCTDYEIIPILSNTPQLRRLICEKSFSKSILFGEVLPVTLFNLTHIFIKQCRLRFDDFEIFIRKISSPVQVLKIISFDDSSYLDADRWEGLISQNIPQLRTFYFEYHELFDHTYQLTSNHQLSNRFTYPFWTQRQWIFDIIIDIGEIIYSIHPYKKRWFEYDEMNASSIQLTITRQFSLRYNRSFIDKMNLLVTGIKIAHLDIDCRKISITTLINLINHLPNLNSLKVSYLPLPEPQDLIVKNIQNVPLPKRNPNITKINLNQISRFKQVQFLTRLCPCMRYLVISWTNDEIPEKLKKIIDFEQVYDYTNRCVYLHRKILQ